MPDPAPRPSERVEEARRDFDGCIDIEELIAAVRAQTAAAYQPLIEAARQMRDWVEQYPTAAAWGATRGVVAALDNLSAALPGAETDAG